jgi:hypothetical protein
VGISKTRQRRDSQRARRHDIAPGTNVPHDGTAEVPVLLDVGRHKSVHRVQMARMRPVGVPVTQSGSSASRLRGGGNVGRAAWTNPRDIQQGGTVGVGKGHLNVCLCPLTANRWNTNRAVTEHIPHIVGRTSRDVAEKFVPLLVSAWRLPLRQLQLMVW